MRLLYVFIVFAFVAGCGGGGNPPPNPKPPDPPPTSFTVDLIWDIPLEYDDGTPLLVEDLKEYRVYYGNDHNNLKQSGRLLVIPQITGSTGKAQIPVGAGIWHFAVTAVSKEELESDLSNVVTYSFS